MSKVTKSLEIDYVATCHDCNATLTVTSSMSKSAIATTILQDRLVEHGWTPLKAGTRIIGVICDQCLTEYFPEDQDAEKQEEQKTIKGKIAPLRPVGDAL